MIDNTIAGLVQELRDLGNLDACEDWEWTCATMREAATALEQQQGLPESPKFLELKHEGQNYAAWVPRYIYIELWEYGQTLRFLCEQLLRKRKRAIKRVTRKGEEKE